MFKSVTSGYKHAFLTYQHHIEQKIVYLCTSKNVLFALSDFNEADGLGKLSLITNYRISDEYKTTYRIYKQRNPSWQFHTKQFEESKKRVINHIHIIGHFYF